MNARELFSDTSSDPPVRGFLHRPETPSGDSLILTHGAGGNAQMGLLVALAEAFAGAGFAVLRCDLPFRQRRPTGPPSPAAAVADRDGLRNAVAAMRGSFAVRIVPKNEPKLVPVTPIFCASVSGRCRSQSTTTGPASIQFCIET